MGRRTNSRGDQVSPKKSRKSAARFYERSNRQGDEGVDVNDINVYVRLRPINNDETNKRSRDCVELHNDPALITVDAPHHGLHDFKFDTVFDEYATHHEVYQESSLPEIPRMLLDGIDCTVLAYGENSTGKSHLIFGTKSPASSDENDDQEHEPPDMDSDSQGVMSRIIQDLFNAIHKHIPPSTECRIRFSMVELYLEKLTDLLRPTDSSETSIFIDNQSNLKGVCHLCCLQPSDVVRAMYRGSSFRTQSATKQNQDASRSHVILQLDVEQIDRLRDTTQTSRLRVVDLAASEQTQLKSSRQLVTPLSLEGKMVSASLQSLTHFVKAKVSHQKHGKPAIEPYANVSKLMKYLKSTFMQPCFTTVFLTASPASLSIGETLSTLHFGMQLTQLTLPPIPRFVPRKIAIDEFPTKLRQAESQVENLTHFVKLLAVECRTIRKTGKIKQSHAVWDIISRIAKNATEADEDASDLVIQVSRKSEDIGEETKEDIQDLEDQLRDAELALEKAESRARDYQSEIASLKAEKNLLLQAKAQVDAKVIEMTEEVAKKIQEQQSLERELLTSRFRENEAVVFLRQFRSFYSRLLNYKASMGTGRVDIVVNDIISGAAGVPNITELLDIDSMLVHSGMIEQSEVGKDTNSTEYMPSGEASAQSLEQAEKALGKELEFIEKVAGNRIEPGQVTTYRHKLIETPAGQLALKKDRQLEEEVMKLSAKCVNLQTSINVEKAMVEALSARQGALGKIKAAQEMSMLKTEVERSTNDLQAIVWKMNELHLVNKAIHDKVIAREQQLSTFDERYKDLLAKNRKLFLEKQSEEKRCLETENQLRNQLSDITLRLWQLGEKDVSQHDYLRLTVPASGVEFEVNTISHKIERRISVGDIADEGINLLLPPSEKEKRPDTTTGTQTEEVIVTDIKKLVEFGIQTDEIILDIDDAEVQTDPVPGINFPYDSEGEDELEKNVEGTEAGESSDASDGTNKTAMETLDSEMQTDGDMKFVVESHDASIQTHAEITFDVGIQTDTAEEGTKESVSQARQAVDLVEAGIQTEFVQIQHTKICFEAGTQTDDPPTEIGLNHSKSLGSTGSMDEDDFKPHSSFQAAMRPPKPTRSNDRLLKSNHSEGSISILHTSTSSIGSLGSFNSPIMSTDKKTTKWNSYAASSGVDDRLGASMSVIYGPASKTVDWRSKLRQKGEDVSQTPSGAGSKPGWSRGPKNQAHLPKPPLGGGSKTPPSMQPQKSMRRGSTSSFTLPDNDDNIPEWMSKFREMGIKADENEEEEKQVAPPNRTSSGQLRPDTTSKSSDKERMLRLANRRGSWAGNSSNGSLSDLNIPTSSQQDESSGQPEWMQRFKEIGMKGEEEVIETGPAEEPAKEDDAEEEGEDTNAPEWMRKFKEIGQKREKEVTTG